MKFSLNTAAIDKLINAKVKKYSDEEIGKALRGVAIRVYNNVIRETPQWSGHMAANTTINIDGKEAPGTNEFLRGEGEFTSSKKRKGDPAARSAADERNRWINDYAVKANSKISIGYTAEPTKQYYAEVEAGMASGDNDLRSVNAPGKALARASAKTPKRINNLDFFQYTRDKI